MSKTVLLLASLLLSFINADISDETFYVLHVKGEITLKSTNKLLETGDEFSGNPEVIYSSDHDIAVLLSNKRGRMVLFKNQSEKTEGELRYFVSANILPVSEYSGTRAMEKTKYTYLVFDEKNELLFPKRIKISFVPSDGVSYYFITYKYQGKSFRKKIEVEKNGFIILTKDVFKSDGSYLDPRIISEQELKFYKASTEKDLSINGIDLYFLFRESLEEEVQVYKQFLEKQNKSEEDIKAALKSHFEETYGTLDDTFVNQTIR
ncbi:hypothetical protein WJR50_20545 [Catalinimonas sp. 4WD22]|uniref:hypothetical protein n=1 Tax=Catalinimonas locisalis TaxID=3133978 RepID=UPI0031013948